MQRLSNFTKKVLKASNRKLEKILKGSLNSIPSHSPSVKIQIMGRKICLRCKGKTLLCVDNAQQCFSFTPQANFTAHILNFHWRKVKVIGSNAIFFTLIFLKTISGWSLEKTKRGQDFGRWFHHSRLHAIQAPNFLFDYGTPVRYQTATTKQAWTIARN